MKLDMRKKQEKKETIKVTKKLPPMRSEAACLFFLGDYTVSHASA